MENKTQLKNRISKYYTNIQLNRNHLDIYVVRKAIFKFIQENAFLFNGKVMDLGCGIMPYRDFIKENSKCTSYVGVDFESSLNSEYSLIKPDLFWDGKTIPLKNNSIEVVLCTELLEHCQNSDEILQEAFRVLKPGGKLLLTVPFLWNLHLVPYDEYRYTPFSLNRILSNAGFKSIELRALGAWDASLAQILGIWYQQRPLRARYIYYPIFKIIISYLLKKDSFYDKKEVYREGLMLTGISGIATKDI
jgi:SAM-dependent methyltransferase